jgi:uncharacterized membrane protein
MLNENIDSKLHRINNFKILLTTLLLLMAVYFSFLCMTYKYIIPIPGEKSLIHIPKCPRCRWILGCMNTINNV